MFKEPLAVFRSCVPKTASLFNLQNSFISDSYRCYKNFQISKKYFRTLDNSRAFLTYRITEKVLARGKEFSDHFFACSSFSTTNSKFSFQPLNILPLSAFAVNRALYGYILSGCSFSSRMDSTYLIKVPNMGDSITEGTIGAWKKAVGDIVVDDEVICVVETDKVSVDIHADIGGRIISHAAEEGETVYVGGDLVTLDISVPELSSNEKGNLKKKKELNFAKKTSASTSSDRIPRDELKPISTGSRYTPLIKFPVRKNTLKKKENSEVFPVPAGILKESALENVLRYEDGNLPNKYRSRSLSEEEISAINSGGIFENTDRVAGKWRTIIQESHA